ncbi:MAG: HAMP domain-containing sensor histidine kinase [Acidobacteriota bacterium]|nr:HAMP domain-containing sensor histidine kinase [Acidobacteriota bacterium]
MPAKTRTRRYLKRTLMIVPPLLFLLYTIHSINAIRALLSSSSAFHMDYADNLIEDYLELEIDLETERLQNCQAAGESCDMDLIGLIPDGEPVEQLDDGTSVYLKRGELAGALPDFFNKKKGLSSLFTERFHEPVYWFRILDDQGNEVYRSTQKPAPAPQGAENRTEYRMDRTLVGYRLDIIYNSFGAKQLYSVAQNRINFGFALFLFMMAVFSIVLVTASIRQKLILARQKTFFVSTVSHEFKTPLAIMKLATETLAAKRFKSEEEEHRFRGMLTNEISRLDHLVHKILSFNKIEMNQIQFHDQDVDLRLVLEPSLEVFRARALTDKLRLEVTMDEGPVLVHGDPQLIRHAVDNIIENAFKYRGDSDLIEVSLKRREGHALLTIRDHGVGIAREELPHILKSFYRVNDPVTQGIRGSGLGLAISNYILEHSKAELTVESELRKGSTFTIRFPFYEAVN